MLWITFALALLRLLLGSGTDFQTLLDWTYPLHHLCTENLSRRDYDPIYQGLICGESQLPAATETLFKQTGLYHLLIVSGSHFVFMEQALNVFFKKYTKSKLTFYIIFAAVCQFNPPVVRALLSLLLQRAAQKYVLFWRPEQIALYSGLSALILFPEWWLSHSLLLSWLASLALCFAKKTIYQHILIFFFIFPILFNSSLYTVLNNILAAPVFGFFYFPVTIITALIPGGAGIGNFIWHNTYNLMAHLPFEPLSSIGFSLAPFSLLWVYVFFLHLFRRCLWRRRIL